jgi:hypothetical protein
MKDSIHAGENVLLVYNPNKSKPGLRQPETERVYHPGGLPSSNQGDYRWEAEE